ncbi:MAG: M56 family metallopeptidase [Polyangiaceae bacterium]
MNEVLRDLWLVSILVMLGCYGYSWLSLRHAARSWRDRELLGTPVKVSAQGGPAVMGFLSPDIVIPRWLLRAEQSIQAMVLAHELEHVRARDPWLLLLGLTALAVTPWNVFLWWQLRRLRFAMEVDCDARVLRRGIDAVDYGEMLLQVGVRGQAARQRALLAVALIEPRSQLEHRLRILVNGVHRYHRWLLAAGICLSASMLMAATQLRAPVMPDAPVSSATVAAPDWSLLNREAQDVRAAKDDANMVIGPLGQPDLLLAQTQVTRPLPALSKPRPHSLSFNADSTNASLDAAKAEVARRFPELYQQSFKGTAEMLVLLSADGSIERVEKSIVPPTDGYVGPGGTSPNMVMRGAGLDTQEIAQLTTIAATTMPAAMLDPARRQASSVMANSNAAPQDRQAAVKLLNPQSMTMLANNLRLVVAKRRGPDEVPTAPIGTEDAKTLQAAVQRQYPELFTGPAANVTARVAVLLAPDRTVLKMVKYSAVADPANESLQVKYVTLTMGEGVAALGVNADEIGRVGLSGVPTSFVRADGKPFNVPVTYVMPLERGQQPVATEVADYAVNQQIAARYFPEQMRDGAEGQQLWVLLEESGAVLATGVTRLPSTAIGMMVMFKNPGLQIAAGISGKVRASNGQALGMYFVWARGKSLTNLPARTTQLADVVVGVTAKVGLASTAGSDAGSALPLKFGQAGSSSISGLMRIEATATQVNADEVELRLKLQPVDSQAEAIAGDPWPKDGPFLRIKYGSSSELELSNGTQQPLHLVFTAERITG